jgi:adenosine deaminase
MIAHAQRAPRSRPRQTDDKGIFSTSLSHEYALAAAAFGLSPKQLFELSRAGIECVFAPESDKEALRQLWREEEGRLI